MPHKIEITLPRRFWRPWRTAIRRDLPASWKEVAPARRMRLLRLLFAYPGDAGRLRAIGAAMRLPVRWLKALNDDQLFALLQTAAWLDAQPTPDPLLPEFVHRGITYHAPLSHGLNMVALEYPIADEAFGNFVRKGTADALALLAGTLYREANPDHEARVQRGDIRVPLRTRWEAEARAKRLEGLPECVSLAVALYFAGVKMYISKAYGAHLFEPPDDDQEEGAGQAPDTTPSLGWWSVYFNLATDGPFGRNVEEVYQAQFHDVCLYLVDRKRQQERQEMQQRMSRPDFGIEKP